MSKPVRNRTWIAVALGILLLSGLTSSLVQAKGTSSQGRSETTTSRGSTNDNDDLECPSQGLPACAGQMNDDRNEAAAEEGSSEGQETETASDESNSESEGEKAGDASDKDSVEHDCPPACDPGEKP